MYVWGAAQRGVPMQVNVIGTIMFLLALGLVLGKHRRAPYPRAPRRLIDRPCSAAARGRRDQRRPAPEPCEGFGGRLHPPHRSGRRWGATSGRRQQHVPGLGEHLAQDLLDLVEVRLVADQRRGELDDRVAAVVGTAVEPALEERLGQEAAQQPLGLGVVEGLLGRLVLDQLDPVEVAVAADVADDRQVVQLLQRRPEARPRCRCTCRAGPRARRCRGSPGRPRSRPGGRRRCSRAGTTSVSLRNGSISRSLAIIAPRGE